MRTDIFTQLQAEHERMRSTDRRADASDGERQAEATIGGETVEIGDSETTQTYEGTFVTAEGTTKGVPRGREALEAREIARTAGMQIFANTIVDQLLGAELDNEMADGYEDDERAIALADIFRDVLEGPHLHGVGFDDLVAAWVDDMLGPGEALTEPLPPRNGADDLPAVALKPIDPLTMRRNVDDKGNPQTPAWYQAPYRTLAGSAVTSYTGSIVALEANDVIVMRYPGSDRSDRIYPLSPAMQVKAWLEMLNDSTTHHSRYYSDNELPPGVVSAMDASSQDIDNIRDEIQAAKGDPRSAPVIGTDVRWVEIGGSAIDLSIIEEQEWFIQLCGAALGVPKTELSLDDEINYSTSATEERIIHKRVTRPISKAITQALNRQLLPQFPAYQALGRPFEVRLRNANPAQERAMQQHYLEQYQAGGLTWNEYRQKAGRDADDVDTVVEIGGEAIDYGDLPVHVLNAVLSDVSGGSVDLDAPGDDEEATDEDADPF